MWVDVPPKRILFYLFILTLEEDYTRSRVILNMTINEQTKNNLQMIDIREAGYYCNDFSGKSSSLSA